MYFKKDLAPENPFAEFERKKTVYQSFFAEGTKQGHQMYLASRAASYQGGLVFANACLYRGSSFIANPCTVKTDAVYDRSADPAFPPENLSKKVLNCARFKKLCDSKNLMYQLLEEYMPKTFPIKDKKDFHNALNFFPSNALAVLKPSKGLGGKGIVIGTPSQLKTVPLKEGGEYSLQEFIDTSRGISGIAEGRHDLRVAIVEGKIVFSHVRTPKQGSYLANVSQGGSLQEVLLENIPSQIIEMTKKVQSIIDPAFHYPVYSIDFGIMKDRPYVFEINDRIGFPSEDMQNAPRFITALLQSLLLRARA